ncbi:MAG: hypothetical protein SGJ02_13175 [bacterium]|mgnify:CR=1 FL=1|nr:hypothetical protein [bacterium]
MTPIQKKKITVILPDSLLSEAMKATGGGTTATIILALKLLAAGTAYDELRSMRGKFKSKLNLAALRKDR